MRPKCQLATKKIYLIRIFLCAFRVFINKIIIDMMSSAKKEEETILFIKAKLNSALDETRAHSAKTERAQSTTNEE